MYSFVFNYGVIHKHVIFIMSVLEIGSVWYTSRLNPYREPRLVFVEAKVRFTEAGQNDNDLSIARDIKGRDVEIRENFHYADINVSGVTAKARVLKVNKASIQFCFQSTSPEYHASIFKRDNPCLKITRCTLYTRQQELFEKKRNAFIRSPAKLVVIEDDSTPSF